MKYYKDNAGNVYAFEADGSQDAFIRPDMVRMTQAEVDAHFSPSLQEAKTEKKAQLRADYEAALAAGVSYAGAMFQSDAGSIAALAETLTAIANGWPIPAGFAWLDADNAPHAADLPFLQGLSVAMADHKAACFARLQAAKGKVRAAASVAEVEAVTY